LAVDLEDLEPKGATHEGLQLLRDFLGRVSWLLVARAAGEVHDLADRHEAADTKVDDQAALVVIDDACLDDLTRLEALLHGTPLPLEPRSSQRDNGVPFRGLRLEDVDEDLVADLDLRPRVVAVPTAASTNELAIRNDAF